MKDGVEVAKREGEIEKACGTLDDLVGRLEDVSSILANRICSILSQSSPAEQEEDSGVGPTSTLADFLYTKNIRIKKTISDINELISRIEL